MEERRTYTAFVGPNRVVRGEIRAVLEAVHGRQGGVGEHMLLLFDDDTGGQVEFDLEGTLADVLARLDDDPLHAPPPPPRPGRPKLGVVSREVSLLPRHWAWLDRQPGGASGVLRRLVEAASKTGRDAERARRARDAAGKFMWSMAGDLPGFEEASRALYAGNCERLAEEMAAWPADVRSHVEDLLGPAVVAGEPG